MKRSLASLAVCALVLSGGIGVQAHAEDPPFSQPEATLAPRAQLPTTDDTASDQTNEARRVMVLLKSQPSGKGNEEQGLASVNRVIARWEDKEGFQINRKFGMLVNGFSAMMPQNLIAALAADPDVASVTPMKSYSRAMETAGDLTKSVQARTSHDVDGRGLVVSIIDSGIDINHQDMRLDDGVQGKLTPAEGFTEKVPYGWNYADDNADVKDTGSEHGMHVAGIVAANGGEDANVTENGRINGIAPNAQLLAMKVFSNDPAYGSAYEDDIVAAIEDSVKHGADIINMSLGSPNGTNQTSAGDGLAIKNAQAAGVQVIVSAGNEGLNGSSNNLTDSLGLLDDGPLGSPSSSTEALSIASVNNTQSIATLAKINAAGKQYDVGYQIQTGAADGKAHKLVYGGLGKPDEIPAQAKGNYVLIQRGELAFSEKFTNAIAKGAAGVIVYNNEEGGDVLAGMAGLEGISIPGAFLYHSVGKKLVEEIAAGEVTITLTNDPVSLPSSEALQPSVFTSWGATPELDFKPQLAGIGGSVYSTQNDNKYAEMSGTSMSAPHVAGVFALGLQEYETRFADLSASERNTLLRTSLSNTAKMLESAPGVPYAPRQIGAGLVQTEDALNTNVFATVDGSPTVALREVEGSENFTVSLKNLSDKDATFTVGGTCVVGETQDPKGNSTYCSNTDTLSASAQQVTVPKGGTAEVAFTLTTTGADHWVQGWATFTSQDQAQPSLSVPYLGFAGDWNQERIVDEPRDGGNPLMDQILNDTDHKSFTGLIGFDAAQMDTVATKWFSPNGDGNFDEVLSQLMMLRTANDIQFEVLQGDKSLTSLGMVREVQRPTLVNMINSGFDAAYVPSAQKWDGRVYNPETDKFEAAPDGKYTFRIKARLSADFDWQTTDLSFGLDRVAPTVDELTFVKNADGSLTYTAKVSDDRSGVAFDHISAVDGMTQDALVTAVNKTTSTVTIQVPADLVGEDHYVDLRVYDVAGNGTRTQDFQGRDSVQFEQASALGRWVNSATVDPTTQQPIITDGKAQLTLLASAKVAKASVSVAGGKASEVSLKHGKGEVQIPVKAGVNDIVAVALDAQGNELGRTNTWLGLDDEAPEITLTSPALNERGEVQVGANGKVILQGTITDNEPAVTNDGYQVLDSTLKPVTTAANGSFNYEVTVAEDQSVVTVLAYDHYPSGLNVTAKSWPIAGRSAASPMAITFDDPKLRPQNPSSLFGDLAYIVDPSFQNLTMKDEGATLRLKGTFSQKPGSFTVAGKEITVGDDLRFDIPLELENGINHFGYEINDTAGNRVIMGSWRFFYDRELPGMDLVSLPAIADDGAVYLPAEESEVTIEGAVWDNQFGYRFAVNGSIIKEFDRIWNPGADKNRQEFEHQVTGRDGETMRLSLHDLLGNGFEQAVPFVYDAEAPTVKISGVNSGEYITSTQLITVLAQDANVKDLVVTIDGKEYAAKVVATALHPKAYYVPFLNGQAQQGELASNDTAQVVELSVGVTDLPAGKHVLEAVSSDKAGHRTVGSAVFTVDDSSPVINGPDSLIINPDADRTTQLLAAYTVTDDADKDLKVQADLSKLVLDQESEVILTAVDGSGKMTKRMVKITLQRPITTLAGKCGSMTGRFLKGDKITITCTKQTDGSVIVWVKNEGITVDGNLTVTATGSPVYLLDNKGNVVQKVSAKTDNGRLTFASSSKAIYRIGELAPGQSPIVGHKPGRPVTLPGLPKTGN